jgi:hypothetical protein
MPYPMQIQILQDQVLVREIVAETIAVNPSFEKSLFDIEYLRTQYEVELSEEVISDDMEEVQETIREFKRRYQ